MIAKKKVAFLGGRPLSALKGGFLSVLFLISLPALQGGAVWAARPRRVVSLSPNITESVFALGAGGQLAGVSDFSNYPPEARRLKNCGGWSNPNFEVISMLHPDLILVLGKHQRVRDFGKERGIDVQGVSMDSVATIFFGLRRLGELLGREDEATSLTARIRGELDGLQAELDRRPDRHRPTALISIGRNPGPLAEILTATGGSFLDELLTLAGGKNIFGDITQYYPQVSKETLMTRQPEVILELTGGVDLTPEQQRALIGDWQALPSIHAVKNGRISVLNEDYLAIPGPRLPQIVRTFRNALYPAKDGK